jgi:hypothetical protein
MATEDGKKTGGRKKGTPNKLTRAIKDAIIEAAELHGKDGKGKDGTVGYMLKLASEDPRTFAGLLGKAMPIQHEGSGKDGEMVIEIRHKVA